MECFPAVLFEIMDINNANGKKEIPNNSAAKIVAVMGDFAAAPNTATIPIPARYPGESGIKTLNALPSVAPIKNRGVTSPPLKPDCKVITVSNILSKNSCAGAAWLKLFVIVGIPSPAISINGLKSRKVATKVPPIIIRM